VRIILLGSFSPNCVLFFVFCPPGLFDGFFNTINDLSKQATDAVGDLSNTVVNLGTHGKCRGGPSRHAGGLAKGYLVLQSHVTVLEVLGARLELVLASDRGVHVPNIRTSALLNHGMHSAC